MADLIDAQGTTLTTAGLTASPIAIGLPGWEKSEINRTTLANVAHTTSQLSKLKKWDPLTFMLPYDATKAFSNIPSTNQVWTVTFPSAGGAWTFWGTAKKMGKVELIVDANQTEQLAFEIEVTITNLNGASAETGPAFT